MIKLGIKCICFIPRALVEPGGVELLPAAKIPAQVANTAALSHDLRTLGVGVHPLCRGYTVNIQFHVFSRSFFSSIPAKSTAGKMPRLRFCQTGRPYVPLFLFPKAQECQSRDDEYDQRDPDNGFRLHTVCLLSIKIAPASDRKAGVCKTIFFSAGHQPRQEFIYRIGVLALGKQFVPPPQQALPQQDIFPAVQGEIYFLLPFEHLK